VDGPAFRKAQRMKRKLARGEVPMEVEEYEKVVEDLLNPNLVSRGKQIFPYVLKNFNFPLRICWLKF
jgi:hypothetical protein